jgi:drug/metabolite transporter (DMT)-like permease
MFKERLTKQQWLGLSIGFLGFVPILLSSSNKEQLLGEFMFISWPEIAVFVAVACSSYSWMVMRKLVRVKSYAPATVNGACMLAGGLLALPTAFLFETWQPIGDPGTFVSWLALIIIISNIVCHNLYAYLLHRYSATFLAFSGFLGPLFAAFYGWIFLNERVGWHFFLSAALVFIGLYLFYQHELQIEPVVKDSH